MKLATQLLLASGLILTHFSIASFGILFRAQSHQATAEMDHLLKNETLALSVLVNTTKSGEFDFEVSPDFLSQYQQHNPNGFFRFVNPESKAILKESKGAPQIGCDSESSDNNSVLADRKYRTENYRVETYRFHPEIDGGLGRLKDMPAALICLVVGIDEKPYRAMVIKTLESSIPLLIAMVLLLIIVMFVLVRTLTRDLSNLTIALAKADFSVTHEFPALPSSHSHEVKAVVEKLITLHLQATNVYREMWLFLGRASHQLKTPVTAMQSTLEVLLRKDRTKPELMAGLTDVKMAATQLGHLTKGLIASSRISYEPPDQLREALNLREFILKEIRTFEAQAGQLGVSLRIASDSEILVHGNRFLLTEIFGSVIENAILYSPHGEKSEVLISWELEFDYVTVVVSDRGPGFSPQVLKTLFEPFTHGNENIVSGSGLGLFIAKKSARLMLGDVFILETGTKGSKIAVRLPIFREASR